MKKKNENKIVNALRKVIFPIYDERHNLTLYLDNEKARSNQTRIEHIARSFHKLKPEDIESLKEGLLKKSKLRKDPIRKDTFNYYFVRKSDKTRYIKVSIQIVDYKLRIAKIKTIFVTKEIK